MKALVASTGDLSVLGDVSVEYHAPELDRAAKAAIRRDASSGVLQVERTSRDLPPPILFTIDCIPYP